MPSIINSSIVLTVAALLVVEYWLWLSQLMCCLHHDTDSTMVGLWLLQRLTWHHLDCGGVTSSMLQSGSCWSCLWQPPLLHHLTTMAFTKAVSTITRHVLFCRPHCGTVSTSRHDFLLWWSLPWHSVDLAVMVSNMYVVSSMIWCPVTASNVMNLLVTVSSLPGYHLWQPSLWQSIHYCGAWAMSWTWPECSMWRHLSMFWSPLDYATVPGRDYQWFQLKFSSLCTHSYTW